MCLQGWAGWDTGVSQGTPSRPGSDKTTGASDSPWSPPAPGLLPARETDTLDTITWPATSWRDRQVTDQTVRLQTSPVTDRQTGCRPARETG